MASSIVSPVGMEFKEWVKQIQADLPNIVIPLPPEIEKWRFWANQLLTENSLGNVPVATKQVFPDNDDWRKWANYFVETIYLN